MKPKIFKTIIFFSLLLTFSCKNDDENSQTETTIEFIEIGKDALYGNGQEGITQSNMVISNQTDWKNLMNQLDSVNNTTNNFNETDIDFESFTVIAVFLEIKGSGWEIEINNVVEDENLINVSSIETQYANSVITQPFHIIKIPKTEKPIIFE